MAASGAGVRDGGDADTPRPGGHHSTQGWGRSAGADSDVAADDAAVAVNATTTTTAAAAAATATTATTFVNTAATTATTAATTTAAAAAHRLAGPVYRSMATHTPITLKTISIPPCQPSCTGSH